jgi:hypothetical protein
MVCGKGKPARYADSFDQVFLCCFVVLLCACSNAGGWAVFRVRE